MMMKMVMCWFLYDLLLMDDLKFVYLNFYYFLFLLLVCISGRTSFVFCKLYSASLISFSVIEMKLIVTSILKSIYPVAQSSISNYHYYHYFNFNHYVSFLNSSSINSTLQQFCLYSPN